MEEAAPTGVSIETDDHRVIEARVFEPKPNTDPPKPAVLMLSAMGVPQTFYAPFARWLAERGHRCLTMDYRGIGASVDRPLRGDPATLADWGHLDIDACLKWLSEHGDAVAVIAHSVGGQVFPLAPRAKDIVGAFMVGSQSGGNHNWTGMGRARILAVWWSIPTITYLMGALPGRLMGGQSLPPKVARQWAYWGRHRRYLQREEALRHHHSAITAPVCLVSVADDTFYAPPAAVDNLASWFTGATVTRPHIVPSERGLSAIGHFGWFRKRASVLWEDAGTFLDGL